MQLSYCKPRETKYTMHHVDCCQFYQQKAKNQNLDQTKIQAKGTFKNAEHPFEKNRNTDFPSIIPLP